MDRVNYRTYYGFFLLPKLVEGLLGLCSQIKGEKINVNAATVTLILCRALSAPSFSPF